MHGCICPVSVALHGTHRDTVLFGNAVGSPACERLIPYCSRCRAALKGKDRELEGQKSIMQQHEKHEAEVKHETDLLNKQHVKAQGAAQKQVHFMTYLTLPSCTEA